MTRERREAGFTLAEALVTLVLVSVVSLLIFEGLRFSREAWTRREARTEAVDQALAASRAIRAVLDGALTDWPGPWLRGDEAGLTVLSAPDLDGLPPGARLYRLRAEEGALILDSRAFEPDPDPEAEPPPFADPRPLATGIEAATFRYLGPEGWSADWPLSPPAPRLVEAEIAVTALPFWPRIAVAPGQAPVTD